MNEKLPTHYICAGCHEKHAFPHYVFAHWGDEIVHSCDCGAQALLLRGVVRHLPTPQPRCEG